MSKAQDDKLYSVERDGVPVYLGPGVELAEAERLAGNLLERAEIVCLNPDPIEEA